MSGSRIARRQARSRARRQGRNDINIVPMLDVMVILIFFLIFTAVFSKTRILELKPGEPGKPATIVDYRGTYEEYLAATEASA